MIGVVIPYYKDKVALDKCLDILHHQKLEVKIYIRDNSDDNIYFTKAINEGIRQLLLFDTKYILVLNQDCYLDYNCLEELVKYMESNPKCGISAPVQYDSDGDIGWAGSRESFPEGKVVEDILSINPYTTPWVCGACMLVRTDMIREIGLLDENMQFICSDSDYSFTARARGWELYVVPDATTTHDFGMSGGNDNYELNKIKQSDMTYYYHKWLSGGLYDYLKYK
jgi:GT2 family glycosyltransferase